MKKLLYLIILLPVLFTVSCESRICGCIMPKPMLITALKNDSNWTARSFEAAGGYVPTTISAVSLNYGNKNAPIDTLVMTINYVDGQTIYKLNASQVYYHSKSPDGTLNTYQLDTLYDSNMITVNQYSTQGNFVQGTFSLKFLNPGKPDISFLGGKFEVPVNE